MTRADQVAEIMAEECTPAVRTLQPGRPYLGPKITAEQIGQRLGCTPSYVRQIQAHIRSRLGSQAI